MTGSARIAAQLDRLVLVGVAGIAVLAPLAFASVETWLWAPLVLMTGGLSVVWGGARMIERRVPVPVRWVLAILLPYALAVTWAGLQLAPWTPAAWHHPLWQDVTSLLDSPAPSRITLDPVATADGILRLVFYAMIGWLTLQLARDRRRAHILLITVVATAAVNAAFGLAEALSRAHLVAWLPDTPFVTGSFVNRNHFATHAGVGLVAATALAVAPVRRAFATAAGARDRGRLMLNALVAEAGPVWAAWSVIALALIMSVSRAGVTATAIALIVLVLALAAARRLNRLATLIALTATLAAVALYFMLVGSDTAARFQETAANFEGRWLAYKTTLRAISDAPWTGTGLGTFRDVFAFYQPAELAKTWFHAHNSYLENALELGIPAATALTLAGVAGAAICFGGVRHRRRDQIYPAVGLAASILVGAHALVDFSLQIPGAAVTYVVVLMTGVAQSWSSREFPS